MGPGWAGLGLEFARDDGREAGMKQISLEAATQRTCSSAYLCAMAANSWSPLSTFPHARWLARVRIHTTP